MAKTSSVIEINGNRYDAVTGQMLGTVKNIASQVKSAPMGVIDGFTQTFYPPAKQHLSKTEKSNYRIRENQSNIKHSSNNLRRKTDHSSTLMRSAVKRPTDLTKSQNTEKSLYNKNNTVIKHAKVNRFGIPKSMAPARHDIQSSKPQSPKHLSNQTAISKVSAMPASAANASSQQLERLLDYALVRADAHKKTNNASRHSGLFGRFLTLPKMVRFASAALVVLLLGSFFAWQNVPQVSMRVAAARASIPAAVPGYTPSGFSFAGPIGYNSGKVSINFKANGDSARTFTISQQKSNWTSQTLVANMIPKDSRVQTSQVKGTTVYIYGQENHATWVDKGVRYTLHDNASLNSDQILKIAESM